MNESEFGLSLWIDFIYGVFSMEECDAKWNSEKNLSWDSNDIHHYRCYLHNDADANSLINGVAVPEAAG